MRTSWDVVLTTDRMVLRRFTVDDVDALVDLDADPEVMRFLARVPPGRQEVESVVLPRIIAGYTPGSITGTFAAHDRVSGAFIGWFALSGDPRRPSLGYRLRRGWWGRGFATEGARALVDRAFEPGRADLVSAQTMFVNSASRRVMEKCGLRYARTFHVAFDDPLPGTQLGEVEYRLTREQWISARESDGVSEETIEGDNG